MYTHTCNMREIS